MYRQIGGNVQAKYVFIIGYTIHDKEATEVEIENTQKDFTYQWSRDTLSDVGYVGDNFFVNVEEGNIRGCRFLLIEVHNL